MNAKHTPGPWQVKEQSGSGIGIWAEVDLGPTKAEGIDKPSNLQLIYELSIEPQLQVGADGKAYVHVAYESWRQFPSIAFDEMQRANARLIAASPELLKGAHAAFHALQSLLAVRQGISDELIREVALFLQAAISTAEDKR